jgi:hypothetical protein
MEKGEADNLGVDPCLIDWALKEGIIEGKAGGGYRLRYNNGNSSNGGGDGGSFVEHKESAPPSQMMASQPGIAEESPTKESAPLQVEMDVDK